MTLNKNILGKSYSSRPFVIHQRESIFFSLATGETNPIYFDPRLRKEGIVVPPLYAAVYAHDPIAQALHDPEVGARYETIVHFSQSFEWTRPVRPGDIIYNQGTITQVNNFENGGLLEITVISRNQSGQVVVRSRWSFLDRSIHEKGAGRPLRAERPVSSGTLFSKRIEIPSYQTFVYAEASGDHNAIHKDDAKAKTAGLPGIILHGFATMAYCQRTIVDHLCGSDRDPSKLASLSLGFLRPVFPGETFSLDVFRFQETDTSLWFGIDATRDDGTPLLQGVEGRVLTQSY